MSSNNRLKYKPQPEIEKSKSKKIQHIYKHSYKYSGQNFSNSTKIMNYDIPKNTKSFQENHASNTINTHHRNETVSEKSQKAILKKYRNNRSNRVKSNDIIYNNTLKNNFNDNINLSTINNENNNDNDYYRSALYQKINEDSIKYNGVRNSSKINNNYTVSMNSKKNNNKLIVNKEMHTERQSSKLNINDNFQAMEDMIIDKNYENNIANDEIIIGNKKTTKKHLNENNLNEDSLSSSNENGDNLFEALKNDFHIMYIPNYEKMINDDMLSLEIQLLYEKILELQYAYHSEFNRQYFKLKNKQKNIKSLMSLYKQYKKKIVNLQKINEIKEKKIKLRNSLFLENKKEKNNYSKINNIEFNLWKQMFGMTGKYSLLDKNETKKIVLDIFKIGIFEKYQKIKNNMNELEKKVALNMMKKYNYKTSSTGKNYYTSINNSNIKHDKMSIYSKNRNWGKYKMTFTTNNNNNYRQENNRNSSYAHKKNGKNIYTKKKW